jgi:hypothetical protein
VDIHGDSLLLRAVNLKNQLIDSLWVRKGVKPPVILGKWESESNDTAQSATLMVVGDTLSAEFSSSQDVDWFRFQLQANRLYYFTSMASLPVQLEPDLALYFDGDYQTNLLTSSVRKRNDAGDFRLTGFWAKKSGFYYAKITNPAAVTGSYKLRLVSGKTVQDCFQHETDNTLANAALRPGLISGDTLASAIFPVDDRDYYRITAKKSDHYEVGVIPIKGQGIRDLDTFIALVDSTGKVLAENDDRGQEGTITGELMNNTFSVLTGVFSSSGTLYLRVESYYHSSREPANDGNPGVGEYGVVYTVQTTTTAVEEQPALATPDRYTLYPNYPNPFNQSTALVFDLPEKASIRVEVVDLLGRMVSVVFDGVKPAGSHRLWWNGRNQQGGELASGVYFARLSTSGFSQSVKMVLVR